MKKIAFLLGTLFSILIATLVLVADNKADLDLPERARVKRVQADLVAVDRMDRHVRFSGVLRAADRAAISFTLEGRLVERPVKIGDRLAKDQVIAQLDRRPFENALEVARGTHAELAARSDQSRRDIERVKELVAQRAAPVEELEKVRAGGRSLSAALDVAQARLREAERQLEETELRAPFNGTVTNLFLEPGEFASGGQPILQLSGSEVLELEIEVPEAVLVFLEPGKSAKISLPLSGGRLVAGTIANLGRSAAGPGRLFPVVLRVEGQDLLPGQTAELRLDLPGEKQLTVPLAAVLNPGANKPLVYRLRVSSVTRVPVTIGRISGSRVSVFGDLRLGDAVVTGGFFGLADGDLVEVSQ